MKILFICKKNEVYSFVSYCRKSSGLFNSTRFIVEGLREHRIEANIIEVNDNNDIDRIVTEFKPEIVIIEALWVIPEKFDILKKLHPDIKWFVHMHSSIPFLALEGIAIKWLFEYSKKGIGIIVNSIPVLEGLSVFIDDLIYLPNVYGQRMFKPTREREDNIVNIGCFGAIRPMKNQLTQALAAIQFAKDINANLFFHINASRIETGGDPVLSNIEELFNIHNGTLVKHGWHEPNDFVEMLHNNIDIGMQVSLAETWNIISCDYVAAGLPAIASKEVYWLSEFSKAKSISVKDIVKAMHLGWESRWIIRVNQVLLKGASRRSLKMWIKFINEN